MPKEDHIDSFNSNDRYVLERLSLGDRKVYTYIYGHYLPRLYHFIIPFTNGSKEDAEEIIQEVFLKIWLRREGLIAIRSFEAYLYRMAKNQLIDWRKKQKRQRHALLKLSSGTPGSSPSADENILYEEYHKLASEAISHLPPQQRKIFELRTGEDLSLAEIAARLGLALSTVKNQLYKAVYFIKDYLGR